MDKLFSLFIRYSLVPQKQFMQRASKMIYSMADLAQSKNGKDVKIRSQPNFLSISLNSQKINLTPQPELRQILYTSSVSGLHQFSMIGTKWVNREDQELEQTINHDLERLIK